MRPDPSDSCSDGIFTANPIIPSSGEKYRYETDWSDSGPDPLAFARIYRSNGWASNNSHAVTGMGATWNHSHAMRLTVASGVATITDAQGYVRGFSQQGATWAAINSSDTLIQLSGGAWNYRAATDDTLYAFDADGRLQTSTQRNGWATTYSYNAAGQLIRVTNSFGRVLNLNYNGAGQLAGITTPDGRTIAYGHDAAGRLSSVTYPDGKTRTFVYENTRFPNALTGIFDEAGTRWATFAYNSSGQAIDSQLAGGAEHYTVSPGSTASVTDPLGTRRSYTYATARGKLAVTAGSHPSGTGQADASARTQDPATGLVTSKTDFNNVVSKTAWDTTRRLPLTMTRATGKPEQQEVRVQWHPQFALPVLVTETGRTTAYTYDAMGNLLTQTVTSTAATPNTTSTWSWTYNAQGLVATAKDPAGAVTTYTYSPTGNLIKSADALGRVTQYGYDSANRLISITAPNGLVTAYTYDARDRLLTQTVGSGSANAQTTRLTYHPTGALATLTLPSGLAISYSYDAAHRLAGWSNNRGESGSYTLDGMGNRTAEWINGADGSLAWSMARAVNAVNRTASTMQGGGQITSYGYDNNGEQTSMTNGLQSTSYTLDALRRITAIHNPDSATATLNYNALGAITQVTDFKGVATQYTRDAQGNATGERSPDIGSRQNSFDAGGNLTATTDALGQTIRITRDTLSRPTAFNASAGAISLNSAISYEPASGQLSQIQQPGLTTGYQRDTLGRVTRKSQTIGGSQP